MQTAVPLNNIVDLAKGLIAIRSTQDNSQGLKEVIALAARELTGYTIQQFGSQDKPSLLIHTAKPGTKYYRVILNAHLDVVPGKDNQFTPRISGDKLIGRGAYDMKAAAAVMLFLFKEMAKKVAFPLALQLVTDEELVQGLGTKAQLDDGITTDFALIGECGSNLDVIFENKGIVHATIKTTGVTAHGAYPWKGENAITKMNEVISLIHKQYPIPYSETFETTINISHITTTNEMWNQTPDNCIATLDIRINQKEYGTILDKITSLLPKDVKFEIVQTRTPHYTDPNNPYIMLLADAAKKVTGEKPQKRKTYGGSDTTFFSEKGFDAVEFGPVGDHQHHDDEWVSVDGLSNYYQILKQFLLSIQ